MNVRQECADAKSIGISAHIRPDGDAIGSTMALYLYLKKIFPEKEILLYLENIPGGFEHLKYLGDIRTDFDYEGSFDVFFALDTVSDRMGKAEPYFDGAVKKINIDHHISNAGGCGDVNLVVPDSSSTAEVIYSLIEEEMMDVDIATAIYTGIIHDTGVFQYSNTSPHTMEVVAKLLTFGFPFHKIIEESFYQKSYLQTQIMGRALLESVRFMDGRCVFSCVDRQKMEFYGAVPSDLDGIVNQLRNIRGIECAIFLYETEPLRYKVSLRTTEKVDASKVAAFFGGGGHMRAAGCVLNGTVHDVINNLSARIALQLKDEEDV